MDESPKPPRGRGAGSNPADRFTRLAVESEEAPPEKVPTLYYRDDSRSILSYNESPDLPFDASLNPYRGCEHGCIYCLSGGTRVLMADGMTRPLADLRIGDELYGTRRIGFYRRYIRTRVLAHWQVSRPAYRVLLEDGTALVAGGDHRFLTDRGWKFMTNGVAGNGQRPHLAIHEQLVGPGGCGRRATSAAGSTSDVAGQIMQSSVDLRVVAIEPLGGPIPLFDITTGTGDFIAEGVVSHNCYARPTHEYLGFSAGLDFETRIMVKEDAPELLRRELSSPRWKPQVIAVSGVTDPYQPIERKLSITRGCLEVLAEFRNPTAIVTKNALVLRDADLLAGLARHGAAAVFVSVTTLEAGLARRMEPRTSHPRERLKAISGLIAAGVPAGVLVAPVVPGLTDHELPAILAAAAEAGAAFASFIPLRLPGAVAGLFDEWLVAHYPERRAKVLNRVRAMRGGRLNDPRFGHRMRGEGVFAEQIEQLFATACRRHGLAARGPTLSSAAFHRPTAPQLPLFDP